MDTASASPPAPASARPASAVLDELADSFAAAESVSVGELLERLDARANGVVLLVLALPMCVPNIPGVVARTATHAFVNAAMPFIMEMAEKGVETAIDENPAIETAVNTRGGKLSHMGRLTARKDVDDGQD